MAPRPAAEFLPRVEAALAAVLTPRPQRRPSLLAAAARHLALAHGAKRVRPQLVGVLGAGLGAPDSALIDAAVAVELVHTASLLHDDVVDDGDTRRGMPTVNAAHGNAVAVLVGDYILSAALARLGSHPPELTSAAIDSVAAMSAATIAELEARGDPGVDPARWRTIAEGKTGALFAWCGIAVAHLAGMPEAEDRLARFGRHLGIAFQLADDVKDLSAEGGGKPPFADLRIKNPNYCVALAVESAPALKRRLTELWSRPQVSPQAARRLGDAIRASGAARETICEIEREVDAAARALGPWRDRQWARWLLGQASHFTESMQGRGAA